MSDNEIVVISSSPEPEDVGTLYRNKGKGRATNRTPVDLTLNNNAAARANLKNAPNGYESVLDLYPDCTPDLDENISLDVQVPQASGSGAQQGVPDLPEDPVERTILQVLSVIPNVDPEHVRVLVVSYESQSEEIDVSNTIISQLLENPDYPRIESQKRKGGDDEDEDSPNKRPKVDYLAEGRVAPSDISYVNHAMDHLMRIDFPQIPKDYIKKIFFKKSTLYAPTYLSLRSDLEAGDKFIRKKTSARSETSRGKRKALAENKDFDRERKWLLQYLEDEKVKKAEEEELAECERDGTGVECGCCFGDFPFSWMMQCPDAHLFCRECARRSAEECIGNRKTSLVCMDQSGCKLAFAESEIQRFLPEKTFELWHRIKQEQDIELAGIEGLESCPFCSYAVVIENEQERLFQCENIKCGIVSCRMCKKEDHLPKTCKEVEEDKVLDARHAVEEAMTKALMRNCPKCGQNFVKESGCNKMTCPKCRSLSCYVCRKVIKGYEHFDQTPPGQPRRAGQSSSAKCPLWDSVDQRHADEVKQAAEAAQEEYRRLHPELEQEDLEVELPAALPAPPAPGFLPPPPYGMPGVFPAQQHALAFGFALPDHRALFEQAQEQAQELAQRLVPHGRYFEGMLDPQRAYEELRADRQRQRERYQVAARARAAARAAAANPPPPPPPPVPVPAPARRARRR